MAKYSLIKDDQIALQKELKAMESTIGFFNGINDDGEEQVYDPHHASYSRLVRLYKRGGQCIDAPNDEEAKRLEQAGFVLAG